jgi:hypothetical protein
VKKLVALAALMVVVSGCTSMKVAPVDPNTGYFPSQKKGAVVVNKPMDLDANKDLIVVANSEFLTGQLRNINYFGEVITIEELQKRIIAAGLTDKVPTIQDRIGLSNAAKYYKPFLWLRFNVRGEQPSQYAQFILTGPATSEDYFLTETKLDYLWTGVNDQHNWYPMFNSLIDYIKQNSKTYGR